mmetsp:Transcript_12812/g.30668  ORF Transcript_12812/g.30668 Transcript_12812/m.30668 type:complete len:422 (+) Transcript_12812:39-1304(+)
MTAAVEVRRKGEDAVWYCGTVRDVSADQNKSNVTVDFGVASWPTRQVAAEQVRRPPLAVVSFVATVGEVVEVQVESKDSPPAWVTGEVMAVEQWGAHYVRLMSLGLLQGNAPALRLSSSRVLCQREKMRPVSGEPTLDIIPVDKEVVDVPKEMTSWIDGHPSLAEDIGESCDLAVSSVVKREDGLRSIVLVGNVTLSTRGGASRAARLLEIHLQRARELRDLQSTALRLQSELNARKHAASNTVTESFVSDLAFLGWVVGPRGQRVARTERQRRVTVRVDGDTGLVEISGSSAPAVAGARTDLECFRKEVPLDAALADSALGHDREYLDELRTSYEAHLRTLHYSREQACVEVEGNSHALVPCLAAIEKRIAACRAAAESEAAPKTSSAEGKGKGKGKSKGSSSNRRSGRKGEGKSKGGYS